jgi:hypothetical protein
VRLQFFLLHSLSDLAGKCLEWPGALRLPTLLLLGVLMAREYWHLRDTRFRAHILAEVGRFRLIVVYLIVQKI